MIDMIYELVKKREKQMSKTSKPCATCGGPTTMTAEVDRFEYGFPLTVTLSCDVIVYNCEACPFSFTDQQAETAREVAVEEHLRAIAPRPDARKDQVAK